MNRNARLTCDQGHETNLQVPAHPGAADDQMLSATLDHRRECEADQVAIRVEGSA